MPDSRASVGSWFRETDAERRLRLWNSLSLTERETVRPHFPLWAHDGQLPPALDWRIWLICAGRGFGKTRAGAEWVRRTAREEPGACIALVGGSLAEARSVMVEGESGVLAVSPDGSRPDYEPSLRRLTWPNGSRAFLYSAGEPESLRGPQHSHAWCDEIGKWEVRRATAAWDNLQLGLRLGETPQIVATTTPRATPLLRRLFEDDSGDVAVTRGTTYDNQRNLPTRFVRGMRVQFGRSLLGRQELEGELVDEIEGALWSRALLEQCRETAASAEPARVVIGVDPPASSGGDACGIVVCALGADGIARVLADCSVRKPTPERWARAVANAARVWSADRVVAEANQGGEMVRSVLQAADPDRSWALPLKLVHASRGKAARAEPVATLYETGRARHAGQFPDLEDQLCGLMTGGGYEGPGRSPDRADALVWAMTELMLGRRREPRVWLV